MTAAILSAVSQSVPQYAKKFWLEIVVGVVTQSRVVPRGSMTLLPVGAQAAPPSLVPTAAAALRYLLATCMHCTLQLLLKVIILRKRLHDCAQFGPLNLPCAVLHATTKLHSGAWCYYQGKQAASMSPCWKRCLVADLTPNCTCKNHQPCILDLE